jgi:hypothetical protein
MRKSNVVWIEKVIAPRREVNVRLGSQRHRVRVAASCGSVEEGLRLRKLRAISRHLNGSNVHG